MNHPNYQYAKEQAEKVLQENYISSWPVPVEELVEFEGLGLIHTEFEDGDIAGVINLEKKYLYINQADSIQRQRFTIAHELAHWLLHKDAMQENNMLAVLYRKPLGKDEEDPLEKEANCFAANLLVPDFMLNQAIAIEGSNASDSRLAHIFNVSIPVIGYRRKFLGI